MIPASVALLCSVAGCHGVLRRENRHLVCERRHMFDLSRSGYVNLLRPQDRRSRTPGDSREAALARRRTLDRGLGSPLLATLAERAARRAIPPGAAILDAGCGEGFFVASLADRFALEGWGVDISTAAIDLASRRYQPQNWIVANADRVLPFRPQSFRLILSITGRKNASEFHRLLSPDGALITAVPAPDDLIEIRNLILGGAPERDRAAATRAAFEGLFTLASEETVTSRATVDAAALHDLLKGVYFAERSKARSRLEGIDTLEVTTAFVVQEFVPAAPGR